MSVTFGAFTVRAGFFAIQSPCMQKRKRTAAKTGTPVYVPLPPLVTTALAEVDVNEKGRFFSTGDAKPQTARANWSRYLDSLFELAGVVGGHSHRFGETPGRQRR